MFDVLPPGFDLNDVWFYSALGLMLSMMVFAWRARQITRAQRAETQALALAEAIDRTGVVGPVRERVPARS